MRLANFYLLFFLVIFIISLLLKLLPIINYNFPFTYDQGRDMLELRNIVVGKHLTLIGPTTSINGVFLGPFWYYFNVIPFVLSGGDPQALVYWIVVWYLLAGFLLYYYLNKVSSSLAFFASAIYLMSQALFYSSRFSWNSNLMPPFTIFYFLILVNYLKRANSRNSILLGAISGLSMQIQAAFGILFFPFSLISSFFYKIKLKFLGMNFLSFFITLLPQIVFELRHDFVVSRTFLNEISGKTAILGQKLTLEQTFSSHFNNFKNTVDGILILPDKLTLYIFIASLFFMLHTVKAKNIDKSLKVYFLIPFSFLLFTFIFYLLYQYPLKGWFILGLYIPFIFIIATFFAQILNLRKIQLSILVAIILLSSFISTITSQSRLIPKENDRSTDKSNIRNEIGAIEWVYKRADGKAFKAYNYISAVYDYPYQYLYWWLGEKKYGYHPDTLTYLDNVPEYIPGGNSKFLTKKKVAKKDDPIFLIIEEDEMLQRQEAWLGNFQKYCLLESHTFPWGAGVQVRKVCN